MAEGDAPIARECITTGHLRVSVNQFQMSVERATRILCRAPTSGRPSGKVGIYCRCRLEMSVRSRKSIRCDDLA